MSLIVVGGEDSGFRATIGPSDESIVKCLIKNIMDDNVSSNVRLCQSQDGAGLRLENKEGDRTVTFRPSRSRLLIFGMYVAFNRIYLRQISSILPLSSDSLCYLPSWFRSALPVAAFL